MRSAKAAYDHYLQRKAQQAPSERLRFIYALGWAWLALPTLTLLVSGALGLQRQTQAAVVLPILALAMGGYIHACARVIGHGSRFDHRPPGWADTPNGRLLFKALHRWSLRGFSDVGPETRLATDLKLTPREVSGVLADLAAELGLEALRLSQDTAHDPAAREVLDVMALHPDR